MRGPSGLRANVFGTDLYSIEIYPPEFFEVFDPNTQFEKWTAVEVSGFDALLERLETLSAPASLYADFVPQGQASESDNQHTHFALMSETYKNEIRIRKRRFGNGFTQVTVVLGFRHHPELCHK